MTLLRSLAARQGNALLAALALTLALCLLLALWLMPPPQLSLDSDGGTALVLAQRRWTLLPGDCLRIQWRLPSGAAIHIDGQERRGAGADSYCPRVFQPSPLVEWRGADGSQAYARLDNLHLPDVLANLAGLTLLAAIGIVALLTLWTNAPDKRPNFRLLLALLLAAALLLLLGRFFTRAMTIEGILSLLKALFQSRQWHFFTALLAGLFFGALAVIGVWRGWRRQKPDLLLLGAFLLFILLLYLPFGFASSPHFEQWIMRAYLEGMPFRLTAGEMAQRPMLLMPSAAGLLLTSESFHGLNIVFALTLWGKLVFFYLSLRLIGLRQLYAFLATALFAAYPVDSHLLSMRAVTAQAHALFVLAALWLMLRYQRQPSRLTLAALWLASALCVGNGELGYGLILVAPLWFWRHERRTRPQPFNLTLIWYLMPALKALYLALLMVTGREFYRSDMIYGGTAVNADSLAATALSNLAALYRQTFVTGWGEAIASLRQNHWLPETLLTLALLGLTALLLWRREKAQRSPGAKQIARILVVALLLITPAAAVLIWLPDWGASLWQPYLLVPPVAAVAVFCALLLMTSRVGDAKRRDAALIALCLLLLLPSISRLMTQHGHYVNSARNKAGLLGQMFRLAPALESGSRVIILSDMTADERRQLHVDELKAGVVGPVMYLVLQDGVDRRGWFCHSIPECRALRMWQDRLPDTLVFLLDAQLNLRLLEDPAAHLAAFEGVDYDLARLYHPDAPIPPRAFTMLGLDPP